MVSLFAFVGLGPPGPQHVLGSGSSESAERQEREALSPGPHGGQADPTAEFEPKATSASLGRSLC